MGHGRNLRRGFVEDDTPELTENQVIGRVAELRGKGIVAVQIASMESNALESALAHLPPRFRGVLFLRRGAFVVLSPLGDVDSAQKVSWSIETLLRAEDVKQFRKDGSWPTLFDPPVNSVVPADEASSASTADSSEESE